MVGETDFTSISGFLQVGTNLGFAGLVWYLITQSFPKILERTEAAITRIQEAADRKTDRHFEETRSQIQLIMTAHEKSLNELKEQLRFTVDRHEATVSNIVIAQEKQIDRVLTNFSKCRGV